MGSKFIRPQANQRRASLPSNQLGEADGKFRTRTRNIPKGNRGNAGPTQIGFDHGLFNHGVVR